MQYHRGRIIYFSLKKQYFCRLLFVLRNVIIEYKNDMYGKKILSKIFDLKIHGIPP